MSSGFSSAATEHMTLQAPPRTRLPNSCALATFWLAVLTEIKNRGTADMCIVVCDGLKGLPEAVNTVWDRAVVQTCVIHPAARSRRGLDRQVLAQIRCAGIPP
jgi:hypothetical protein